MMVFFLSFLIKSLVKIRLSEMITPAVPTQKKKISNENLVSNIMTTLDGKKPLTLSGHHALSVAFGKHPHVSIETGLLHWRHNRVEDCYGWKWLGTQCSEHKRMTPNMILWKGKKI